MKLLLISAGAGKSAYAGKVDQAYFSNTLTRIEGEVAKRKTIKDFFSKFGYEGDHDAWIKKSSAPWAKSDTVAFIR